MTATNVKRADLEPFVLAELARRNLGDFCALMDSSYESTRHTKVLVEYLESLERGDIRNLIVEMPPRHSKTYHVSQRFPAWYLGRHPERDVVLGSYSALLAIESSREVRRLASDPRWPFAAAKVSRESASVERWKMTAGGGMLASGVDSRTTGFGGHLIDVDDPFAGRADADSDVQREHVWRWFTETVTTRAAPNAVRLVTHTRWHDDDLIGRILNSSDAANWTVLSLPAIAIEDDALHRTPGEALWPERYPIEQLERQRSILGSTPFEAIYQQNPVPAAGGLFRAEWFEKRYPSSLNPNTLVRIQTVDSAWKTGVGNDYSVIATWGTDGRDYYLLDVWRAKAEYHDLRRIVVEKFSEQRPRALYVEEASSGHALLSELRQTTPIPIIPIRASGSKQSRAERATPFFEAGRVHLPEEAPWLPAWMREHLRFPADKHDDQVDTTSMALVLLSRHNSFATQQREPDDLHLGR